MFTFKFGILPRHKYFQRVRQSYYGGANYGFLVFDLTDRNSYEKIGDWKNEVLQFTPNVSLYLVGNKADLKDSAKSPLKREIL